MAGNMFTTAMKPTAARMMLKVFLSILVAFGIVDDATVLGIIDDPLVIAAVIGLINMFRHEAEYRRKFVPNEPGTAAGTNPR